MKAAAFDYLRPGSLPEALRALDDASASAKLVAGSQSLGPMLNLRLARPARLIDISRLEELKGLSVERDEIRVGAAVTHATIEDEKSGDPTMRWLASVAGGIAYRAIRNRGTMGGSIAHADPAADWPLVLTALSATVRIAGVAGERPVHFGDFMSGPFTTAVGANEIITEFRLPRASASARFGYFKFCRKIGEFAEASAAAVFDRERGVARIALGALSGAPRPLPDLASEVARLGKPACTEDAVASSVQRVIGTENPLHSRMVTTAVMRALQQVFS